MPVSTTHRIKQYTCNGLQTVFPFDFPISAETDLVVKTRIDATGVTTTLVLTTDYTVSKAGSNWDSGGNITTVATYATGTTLIAYRSTTQSQSMDLLYGDTLDSESLEDSVDKLTRIVQELQNEVDRCIKMPISDDPDLSMEMPNSIDRASKWLGFDASGQPTGVQTTPSAVTVTAAAETVLDDATVGAMLTTLGFSAFIQTLINNADAPTARATIEADDYDLVVNSVADLELLIAGDATEYASVYIKHGSYTTAEQLDFSAHGVKYLRGERPDTTIVLTTTTTPFIKLHIAGIYENFTVNPTGAIADADKILEAANAVNNTKCRDISIECTADAVDDGNGFYLIAGGLEGCKTKNTYRGFASCSYLLNCQDEGSVYSFQDCYYATNCYSYLATSGGFDSGAYFTNCQAQGVTGGPGFINGSFYSCCLAKTITGKGFDSCIILSSCAANTCSDDGFEDCSNMSACLSTTNTGYDYDTCSYMSSCKADATGAANWNACATEIDEDSCNMT